MLSTQDTTEHIEIDHPIVALATPRSKSALAIIRITGKNCIALLEPFVQSNSSISTWNANHTKLITLQNPETKDILDQAMLTVYKSPHSFTGQDSVEITMHGSLVGIDNVLNILYTRGFEPAEPGEFTKRAFLAGKIDLTQAEAIHALIESHTTASHALALQQLAGSVSSFINTILTSLVEIAATCNICLDYPDDEIQEETTLNTELIHQLIDMLTQSIESYELTRVHREGATVILAGKTNVGKSTLFNSFLKEERSIVSGTHGTTRDFIESQVSLHGLPLRIFDTAGLRSTTAHIEQEGINRSYTLIQSADLVLYIIDASMGITEADQTQLSFIVQHLADETSQPLDKLIIVWNKIDLAPESAPSEITVHTSDKCYTVTHIHPISALNFQNINALQESIYHRLHTGKFTTSEDTTIINSLRQQQHLKECRTSLQHVLEGLAQNIPLDMISLDVTSALKALGSITGEVSNEEILDIMFSKFCVGK